MTLAERYYGPKRIPSSVLYSAGMFAALYATAAMFAPPIERVPQREDQDNMPIISHRTLSINRKGLVDML